MLFWPPSAPRTSALVSDRAAVPSPQLPPSPLLLVPNSNQSSPPPPSTLHHCSAPAAGRTAAVQQGRSDITASIRPIACFIYFKQHLVPGQRRTCWVFCWKSPCLRFCPYFLQRVAESQNNIKFLCSEEKKILTKLSANRNLSVAFCGVVGGSSAGTNWRYLF